MESVLRIAIIGTGTWGARIIETLSTISGCTVIATATRDYATLLNRSDIDGIIIATPANTHATIAIDCMSAGIPIFVEKPLATSIKDAENVFRAATKHNVPVFVGHIHLYNPAFVTLKTNLGTIGTITSMTAEGCGTDPKRMDINALWDWGPHTVAMMFDIIGSEPRRVRVLEAPTKESTTTRIELEFPNSITATATFSWQFPEKRQRLTVIGTKGALSFDAHAEQSPGATPPLSAELQTWFSTLRSGEIDPNQERATISVLRTLERANAKTSR